MIIKPSIILGIQSQFSELHSLIFQSMYFLLSRNHYVLQDSCDTLGDTGSLKLSAKNHYINEMVRK